MTEGISNFPEDEVVIDDGEGSFVVRDSSGQHFGVGSDGIEIETPAATPEEALDNLAIARMVEDGKQSGREGFVIEIGDSSSTDEGLDGLITALGFDPDEFRP